MATQILSTTASAVAVNGGTLKNFGPSTVFYRDELPVSSGTNDGSITSGNSVVLDGTQYLIASTNYANVAVLPTVPVSTTGYQVPNVQTGNYTLALSDANNAVEINSGSNLTVTVPTEANVPFPYGTIIEVGRFGAGTVTLAAAGGVTLRSPGALLALRAQYSTLTLRKRGTDEWWVAGDLA